MAMNSKRTPSVIILGDFGMLLAGGLAVLLILLIVGGIAAIILELHAVALDRGRMA